MMEGRRLEHQFACIQTEMNGRGSSGIIVLGSGPSDPGSRQLSDSDLGARRAQLQRRYNVLEARLAALNRAAAEWLDEIDNKDNNIDDRDTLHDELDALSVQGKQFNGEDIGGDEHQLNLGFSHIHDSGSCQTPMRSLSQL